MTPFKFRTFLVLPLAYSCSSEPISVPDPCKASSWQAIRAPARERADGRAFHSAVWTGSEVIVWGGQDNEQRALGTGLRIDPERGTVRALSANGAPEPRFRHFAAWTGKEMVVWGGVRTAESDTDMGEPAEGGGLYDPERDSWRPISAEQGPGPRLCASVAWTGAELFVWGGLAQDADGRIAYWDGALYDPERDVWRPITLEPSPEGNCDTQTIAMGGRVLVMGGTIAAHEPASSGGAIYDTEADEWSPLEEGYGHFGFPGAPQGWTGTEAVSCYQTMECHAFSPERMAWRMLDSDGQPGLRVWSGYTFGADELQIFGGADQPGDLQAVGDGAVYDFSADAWRPMPTECAPPPRYNHTLTWTPSGSLVWGGRSAGGILSGAGWLLLGE